MIIFITIVDKRLVSLHGERGSYINASFMNVSYIIVKSTDISTYRATMRRKHLL